MLNSLKLLISRGLKDWNISVSTCSSPKQVSIRCWIEAFTILRATFTRNEVSKQFCGPAVSAIKNADENVTNDDIIEFMSGKREFVITRVAERLIDRRLKAQWLEYDKAIATASARLTGREQKMDQAVLSIHADLAACMKEMVPTVPYFYTMPMWTYTLRGDWVRAVQNADISKCRELQNRLASERQNFVSRPPEQVINQILSYISCLSKLLEAPIMTSDLSKHELQGKLTRHELRGFLRAYFTRRGDEYAHIKSMFDQLENARPKQKYKKRKVNSMHVATSEVDADRETHGSSILNVSPCNGEDSLTALSFLLSLMCINDATPSLPAPVDEDHQHGPCEDMATVRWGAAFAVDISRLPATTMDAHTKSCLERAKSILEKCKPPSLPFPIQNDGDKSYFFMDARSCMSFQMTADALLGRNKYYHVATSSDSMRLDLEKCAGIGIWSISNAGVAADTNAAVCMLKLISTLGHVSEYQDCALFFPPQCGFERYVYLKKN